jgi:hypothetical protein
VHANTWILCGAALLALQGEQHRHDLSRQLTVVATEAFAKGAAQRVDIAVHLGDEVLVALEQGDKGAKRSASFDAGLHAFFGGVAMQLSDKGSLDLESAVGKFLPELGETVGKVTVHQLLTHTAGLHDWQGFPAATAAERLAKLGAAGTQVDPGTCLWPSSGDTFALGVLLARVGGAPAMERVDNDLFDRAGATGVGVCKENGFEAGLAGALGERELCGTAADLVAVMRALAGRKLTSERSWLAMTTGDLLPDGSRTRYGHGLDLARLAEHERVAFGGRGGGADLQVAYYPSFDMTVVVLATGGGPFDAEKLERDLARIVYSVDAPKIRDQPLDAEAAARYTGEYLVGCDRAQVEFRDRHLVLRLLRRDDMTLLQQAEDEFVAQQDHDFAVHFEPGGTRARSFRLVERGFELRAQRID